MQLTRTTARTGAAVLTLSLLATGACDAPVTGPHQGETIKAAAPAATQGAAPFQLWRQGFQHGTAGWITDDVEGPGGWCGDIEQIARGEGTVAPSAGRAHAIVREGACNEFFQGQGFLTSGPASAGQPLNDAFPVGGYVQELDIHLDPDWLEGTGFGYVVSFQNLDFEIPLSFRYLMVPVMKQGGVLAVGGHAIAEPGWYTFQHRFYEDDGMLGVELRVLHGGDVLVTVPLSDTESMFAGETPASLHVDDTGSGYIWFAFITEGLDLPIDEQLIRRGM